MALRITKQIVWAATIQDEPGGLAAKLAPLADAGADLDFVIARRSGKDDGTGVVFVTPLVGGRQIRAATKVGFKKAVNLHALRVEGANRPGLGAKITSALSMASINLHGLSAAVVGNRFVLNLSFDSQATASHARRELSKFA